MQHKLLLAATLTASVAAGGVAFAWQAAPAGDQTRAQFLAKAGERFDAMDADRNGVLTGSERRAHRTERRGDGPGRGMGRRGGRGPGGGMFGERLDTDNDGRVSRAEAAAPMTRMFDRVDANRDGFVDAAERQAAQAARAERRGGENDGMAPTPSDDE